MPERSSNTQAEYLTKILGLLAEAKTAPDRNMRDLLQIETMVLRALDPDPNLPAGMPAGPGAGGMGMPGGMGGGMGMGGPGFPRPQGPQIGVAPVQPPSGDELRRILSR